MSIHKANEQIEAVRDEVLHLESIGRLPRIDYNKGTPDFTAVMSGRCAIKDRLDADFARLFLPQPSSERNPSQVPCSGGGSSANEVTTCTTA